ncbi:MAG: Mediator of RNA polymerase II transcription subunit 6 [Alyxoria varia]|nr:MAG: Mediator of RNA polymerase II transcription subunit 6 [Alyxoria varia]
MESLLDEIVWRDPPAVHRMGGIHENTVLHYFADSPFFDPVSNNRTIQTQAQASGNQEVMETRTAFEAQLDKMYGLEYRVAYGPKQFGPEAAIGEGRWVVRKQQRNRGANEKDEVIILESYFVIGENIYKAPAIEDISWNRILSATHSLTKCLKIAHSLPAYTPARGYRYFDPVKKTSNAKPNTVSELPSRSATPVPEHDNEPTATSASQASAANTQSAHTAKSATAADTQALHESFQQYSQHKGEYMDEAPLVGEPGNFKFADPRTSTMKPPPSKALQAAKTFSESQGSPSPRPSAPGSPETKPELKSVAGLDKDAENQDDGPSRKKRKSKAPGSPLESPTSPLRASSPA